MFSKATNSSKRSNKQVVHAEAESQSRPSEVRRARRKRHPALLQDHQLPGGCAWAASLLCWRSSVLWFDVVAPLDGAGTAGVAEAEAEPTPLEVLMELCWMASFCGLPGMDMSSLSSSLSETAGTNGGTIGQRARESCHGLLIRRNGAMCTRWKQAFH